MGNRVGTGLTSPKTGAAVSLRNGRGPLVIVVVDSAECASCASYIAGLRDAFAEATELGARIVVVMPANDVAPERPAAPDGTTVLTSDDTVGVIGVEPPAIGVADEWGELHFTMRATADHDLPRADEVVDWTRFVAIQCPECEQPEGEWRSL